ncbi:MAG: methyltransferase domain-containing protein [Nanoarchaeota archaeon]|nr:methyltransferase domain-containing protein [Nanoarchaeota archaeon]
MKKLNLGCGKDIKTGFVNADMLKLPGVDKVMNLNKFPWPFESNQFDYVLCSRILEYSLDINKVINELYRITKNKGVIEIISPYYKSDGAFKHSSFITKTTFLTYLPKEGFNIIKNKLVCHGKIRRFVPFKKLLTFFLWNMYDTIYLKVRVSK